MKLHSAKNVFEKWFRLSFHSLTALAMSATFVLAMPSGYAQTRAPDSSFVTRVPQRIPSVSAATTFETVKFLPQHNMRPAPSQTSRPSSRPAHHTDQTPPQRPVRHRV
jgi:hypothetical protein